MSSGTGEASPRNRREARTRSRRGARTRNRRESSGADQLAYLALSVLGQGAGRLDQILGLVGEPALEGVQPAFDLLTDRREAIVDRLHESTQLAAGVAELGLNLGPLAAHLLGQLLAT